MMLTVLTYFGYTACNSEDQPFGECTLHKMPDISHVMGVAPLNKLYAIMLTIYSATKQAEARAYYNYLSTFVSPLVNNFLFFVAVVAMITGPGIGYWDCYFDMDTHCLMAGIFSGAEVIYLYSLCYIMSKNREQFGPHAQHVITRMQYLLAFIAVSELCSLLPSILPFGHIFAAYGEWIAFYTDFIIRFQLAAVIRYTSHVSRD